MARLRPDVRQRAVGQASWHGSQQRDGARMDGGIGVVEGATAETGRDAFLAGTTQRLRGTGAMGHLARWVFMRTNSFRTQRSLTPIFSSGRRSPPWNRPEISYSRSR